MTVPAVLLGLVAALLAGALFHAVRGGSGWRLLLHLGLSVLGFGLALLLGFGLGFSFFKVGVLDVGLGLLGSVFFMGAGTWLVRA